MKNLSFRRFFRRLFQKNVHFYQTYRSFVNSTLLLFTIFTTVFFIFFRKITVSSIFISFASFHRKFKKIFYNVFLFHILPKSTFGTDFSELNTQKVKSFHNGGTLISLIQIVRIYITCKTLVRRISATIPVCLAFSV